MRKILLLLSIVSLAACDKPTSDVKLSCEVDNMWRSVNVLSFKDRYFDYDANKNEKVIVDAKTYDDYALFSVDNITTKFEKVDERKDYGEFGRVSITYKGNFPGSERTALFQIYADITDKKILQYDLSFIGQKSLRSDGRESSLSWNCLPVDKKYVGGGWNTQIPFNHHYKTPNKIEKCINNIVKTAYFFGDEKKLSVYAEKRKDLTQEEALSISSNWNYSDMKLYQNDGKIEDYEKDACDVLERLNKFIYDNDLDAHESKLVENAYDKCGDDCREIFVTGDMGDFINIIPETSEIKDLFNKKAKTVKFLSIENPKQYIKSGYCLVDMVPYDTMKKMGTLDNGCHYRIYCGTVDDMNYDENYAIEVCVR